MKTVHNGKLVATHGPDIHVTVLSKPPSLLKRVFAKLRVKRG